MPRIVVFDLETRKWASDLDPENNDAGWDALRAGKGGASAICLWDSLDDWLYMYDDLSIQAVVKHLEAADVLVGYRSEKFDIPVIEGLIGRKLRIRYSYDLYTEMVRTLADKGVVGSRGDFTLDAVAKRNLGLGKNGRGADAKNLALQGRFGELFTYCGNDVKLTRDLFFRVCRDGGLIELAGRFVQMEVPEWVKSGVVRQV